MKRYRIVVEFETERDYALWKQSAKAWVDRAPLGKPVYLATQDVTERPPALDIHRG